MYDVLLADDEKTILQGMAKLVDWEKHGTRLSGMAMNGEDAWLMIEQNPPHIVISDIKMPEMDGLELIRKVREKHADIRFIILSGYEEFDFAKTAMEYGVKHYLLKPSNEHKISEVLAEVVRELDEQRQREAFVGKMRFDLDKVMPLVKDQFLKEIITNKAYGDKEWAYYSRLFQLGDIETDVRLALFELEGEYDFEHLFALQNIAVEILGKRQRIVLDTTIGERAVVLVGSGGDSSLLDDIGQLQAVYAKFYHLAPTAAVSEAGPIGALRKLYHQALESLNHRFFLGAGSVIMREDVALDGRGGDEGLELEFDHESLALALRSGDTARVRGYVADFFARLKASKAEIDVVKSHITELYMVAIRQSDGEERSGYFRRAAVLQALETIFEMESFIAQTTEEIAEARFQAYANRQSRIVRDMIAYAELHLADESLTLTKVASDILYMNPDYLGKLFKRETGQRFSNYILQRRIERAKTLIAESRDVKVHQIAGQVGFGSSPQYFGQVFKKLTGHSPSDYKKTPDAPKA